MSRVRFPSRNHQLGGNHLVSVSGRQHPDLTALAPVSEQLLSALQSLSPGLYKHCFKRADIILVWPLDSFMFMSNVSEIFRGRKKLEEERDDRNKVTSKKRDNTR